MKKYMCWYIYAFIIIYVFYYIYYANYLVLFIMVKVTYEGTSVVGLEGDNGELLTVRKVIFRL